MARNCVTVELYCDCEKCGNALDVHYDGTNIYVTPCESCMKEARDEGFRDGQENMEGY